MQVYVQKSTATTRPRRPSVVSGGELSHPVAPSREGILPPGARRPGAQPGPRTASRMVSSRDGLVSMTRSSVPLRGGLAHRRAQWPERGLHLGREQLRLLPGGEVPAPVHLVEVAEGRIGLLDPAAGAAP